MYRSHWSTEYNCLHQHRKHPLRPKAGNREVWCAEARCTLVEDADGPLYFHVMYEGNTDCVSCKMNVHLCFRLLCHVQKSATKLALGEI